jgi:hypothetical protein
MTDPTNTTITTDQEFYDQEAVSSHAKHERWMREIEYYFNGYADRLNEALVGSNGHVAELGAVVYLLKQVGHRESG